MFDKDKNMVFLLSVHLKSTNLISAISLKCWVFPGHSDSNQPTMQETQLQSLGQEDSLEKERATHTSIPA